MKKILVCATLITSLNANAVLGPIPIYLNTEYRTDNPAIGSLASTLSFNADDIKATGANTFLDFLATVPSVGLYNPHGNIPALFMRGGESDHTLVLLDGVSVNSADSINGAVEYGLTNIALSDIAKIEVIKNSGSVLYGSSAIAGVISITTKKWADTKNFAINTKFGTHNSKTYTLLANDGDKDGFVRFIHNKYDTDGINAQTADSSGEKDSIDNQTTQIKLGNKNFDVSYLKSRNKTEYDGSDYDPVLNKFVMNPDKLADRKFNKLDMNINKSFSNTWKAKLLLAQTTSQRNYGTNATTVGDKYKSITLTALNDIKVDNALFTVGLSRLEDANTTNNLKHISTDLFVNWQKNIDDLDMNAGLRYIKHNKFGYHNVYNIGIAKELDNSIRLTGNYNSAFQAPTLKQVTSGTQINDLKPETAKNINIGLTKSHAWGEIGLSLFKNKAQDVIEWIGCDPSWSNCVYANQGKYTAKGAEILLDANTHGYNINFDYTYSKSRKNDSNEQPARRPKNIAGLTISKQYDKFSPRIQIISKSSTLDGGVELGGYTLVNLSSGYNVNNDAKVLFNIKNATDKNYTVANGYNQLGRTFEIGLNYQF